MGKSIEQIRDELGRGYDLFSQTDEYKELLKQEQIVVDDEIQIDHAFARSAAAIFESLIPDKIMQDRWLIEWSDSSDDGSGFFAAVYELNNAVLNQGQWYGTGSEASIRANMRNNTTKSLAIGLDGDFFDADSYFDTLQYSMELRDDAVCP
jgi:hypothetical protein